MEEIKERLIELEAELFAFDFDAKMKHYSSLFMTAFKVVLLKKYASIRVHRLYDSDDLWKNSEGLIKYYMMVLSTTYLLRASLSRKFVIEKTNRKQCYSGVRYIRVTKT